MTNASSVRALGVLLLAVQLGCGEEPAAPTGTPPSPAAEPAVEDVAEAHAEEAPAEVAPSAVAPAQITSTAPSLEVPIAPVLLPTGELPEVTSGPTLRLESGAVTTREVDGRRLPSVTLASPTAQANLDAWFESHAWCRGRVQLAIEGFVSYVCSAPEPAAAGGVTRLAMNVRIDESGSVADVRAEDVFLPGIDLRQMTRVWADDPRAPMGEVGFGPAGAVVVPSDDSGEMVHLSWRTIAPYVRADGPLGPALTALGLTLAPAGTSAPGAPVATTALVYSDATLAIQAAARLSASMRAGTRLRVSSDDAVLFLPPDTAPDAVSSLGRVEQRYRYGGLAELVSARVERSTEARDSVGPRAPVRFALPAGASVIAARGPLGSRSSELGGGWALIAGGQRGGYVQGRTLALDEGCGAPRGDGSLGDELLAGHAALSPDQRFVWMLGRMADSGQQLAFFPLDADCGVGSEARRVRVEGALTELHLVLASAEGPEWLVVVVAADRLEEAARTISVFGPEAGAAALYTATLDAPSIHLAERRGPDRAPGYFPVKITSGTEHTFLRWSGSAIEVAEP